MSKILEKDIFNQINLFLHEHGVLEKFQLGFKANHSTEAALTRIVNDFELMLRQRNSLFWFFWTSLQLLIELINY